MIVSGSNIDDDDMGLHWVFNLHDLDVIGIGPKELEDDDGSQHHPCRDAGDSTRRPGGRIGRLRERELQSGCLTAFPKAGKTRRDFGVRSDTVYADFVAEVVDANNDAVTVGSLDPSDTAVVRVKFTPSEDATAMIDGQKIKYSNLKWGTM